ncbi:MAG: insulinase family protein [Alphaproteobacteria bacterium]|nr:insulinase family protein [Alphaproteobacteria bacterium]MBU1515934.1 insulinase family protein [Alphaproteobacteria bacterium]MBU2094156.1 insulinase family protein [Alphaproteobacteria bacterium]MBU2151508.1 insulinase family protein [Alphaproteobacteria bacterium]MBU2305216.1 insulinase family protein [Alphaproteobacteria bacterium]
MIRLPGAGPALAAALTFALAQPAVAQAPVPAAAAKLAPGEWPQVRSDLKADPAIRFGALPNGMRYAIRKQTIPAGQAAFRLWFATGSMMETDAQAGLAHFLEHMAFNGSKEVKEGEMVKILERLGLAFGADTNASTSFSETTYKLDLPRTDTETVDTSLKLLREAAFNLTIDPAAVDRERGIVLSEERARDTPGYRVVIQRLNFLLKGQRLPTRLPIGKVEVLKTAPASLITDYYNHWYRPDRAVFVAVGDFDVDVMEAKIKAAFGEWKAKAPALPEPDQGPIAPRKAEARLVVDPGVTQSLQVAWVSPADLSQDTTAKRRRDLVEGLGLAVLNRRYSAIARGANPPFLGAGASKGEQDDAAEVATIGVNAESGRWREALAAAEQEQRRIVQYGVRQDELDREIEEIRTAVKAAVAGAATRRPADLASEIVGSLADHTVVTSPVDDQTYFEADVKGLTAATVNAALKSVFQGQGPLVFMASPTPIEGGEATLLAALTTSQQVAVTPPTQTQQIAWPYETFGAVGKVAERREIADLGTTFVRFENGVRLTVKPTAFRDDEVLVRVNAGSGMLGLAKDRQSPFWASNAIIEGGLAKIGVEDMERVLASKVYGGRFGITDDAYVLSGGTRTGDLPTQLQVLAAYMTEPGWREAALARIKAASRTIHDQYEATDNGVMARDLPGLLHSGDRRWTFPSRDEMATAKLDDIKAEIMPDLSTGPVEVVIVGDVTVDQAIAATASTFGALPRRAEAKTVPAAARVVTFPKAGPQTVTLTHKGRADQAIGFIAWPTSDYWADPQRARDTAVLREVMKLRLTDQLREAQGATYSPDVNSQHSLVWTGWGYLAANVEVPPEKLAGFFADTQEIAADLRTTEVGADELSRAKKPRIEGLQRTRVTNGYWLGELSGAQADPRRLDSIREIIPGTEKVTAADVKRAAQTWLKPEAAYKLTVLPAPGGAAAP